MQAAPGFDLSRPYTRVPPAGGFDPARSFSREAPLDRTTGQRFRENVREGFARSGAGYVQRQFGDTNANGLDLGDIIGRDKTGNGWDITDLAPNITPGSPVDRVLDFTIGENRGFLRAGGTRPEALRREEERRQQYAARAAADPARGVGENLTAFGGQLVGTALSPESWVGAGKTVASRIASNAGLGAATDVTLQGADIGAGVQDRYDPLQTGLAGVTSGVLQGGLEVAGPAARRTAAGASRGFDYAKWAAGRGVDAVSSRIANPVPDFDGPAMDAASVPFARTGAPAPRSAPAPTTPPPPRFVSPVEGRVSSGFGPRQRPIPGASRNHKGVDYAVPEGTPAGAMADGEVIFAGQRGGYGNRVEVRHADGTVSAYSHLSGFGVRVGDSVRAGQPVGRTGSTGNVSGPHLHLEYIVGGRHVDPRPFLTGEAGPTSAASDAAAPRPVAEAAPIRATEAPAGRLSPPPEAPAPRPEEVAAAREAVLDPAAATRLRAMLTDRLGSSRDARNRARAMIHQARQENPQTLRRLSDVLAENETPPNRTPEGATPDPAAGFDPSLPFERATGEAPTVLGVRGGFDPSRPFSKAEPGKLAVDLSNYGNRIGQPMPSSGQAQPGGLRAAPRPGAVARGQGVEFGGKTVSDLAADLRATLGLTSRQGRVPLRGALGTYDRGSGVIRTKAVDELDILAHEATHALEYERAGPALLAAMKRHAKELKALDYEPGKARRHEGFAEFGRWYLTNPDHARRVAPNFYDAFEQALEADSPDVLAGMRAIQGGYQNLLSSASLDVARASLAYTGNKGPIGNLVDEVKRRGPGSVVRRLTDKLYTAVMDDLHPLAVAERELAKLMLANKGVVLDLKRAESPYAIARLSREVYAAGHNDLMRGVTPYQGIDPEGASLADALEAANLPKDRLGEYSDKGREEFDAYLISRRAVHLWDRYAAGDLPNPPDRNTRQFHEQVIADAEAANPTWADAAKLIYEFQNNLWRKKFDAGLITKESYDNGLTHVDYVPWQRDMSDKGPGGKLGRPRGALQFAGGVHALEGSTRDIISPLSSIMREAYALNALIRKNDTLKALDDLAEKAGPGSGEFVERLPAKQIEAVNIDAEQALRTAADELGLTGRDLSTLQQLADDAAANETTLTLFKPSEFSPRKGEAVVFVWRNGKKTPLLLADGEFGQEMFRALTGLNQQLRNVVVDTMAAGTQLLRYGVTLSPEFIGANLVRDAIATWINTDVGFVPALDTVRGGLNVLRHTTQANRYAAAGGMRGGANTAATAKPFPQTDAEAQAQLRHLQRKGFRVRQISWRKMAEATDLSETSTRMGVFERAFDKAKREGLSDYEAIIEAGFTSRDYLDFGRRGSRMVTASRLVTFMNAALQGLDKTTRVLTAGGDLKSVLLPDLSGTRPAAKQKAATHARKAWAKVAMLGAVGLGLRMLYADDPEYQEINDRLRATHWVFRSGGSWVFIPKPFELATLSNILERAFEGTVLNDPTAGERLLSDFRHTIAPPSEIPALSVPFNLAKNRDYLGRPIVPDHLQGTVDPELQFNSFTSDLAKLIGRTFNLSPAQVDYVITGLGGSIGRYVQQGSNIIGEAVTGRPRTASGPEDTFLARRFVRQIDRGAESQAQFWDLVSRDGGEMTRAEGSFRALLRDAKDSEAAAYLNSLPPQQRAYVVAKVFSSDGESIVHPLVRTQNAVSVIGDFRRALRSGDLRDDAGQVIDLTPQQRRTIDNALADFAMAEMRNALISTGVRGWNQKQAMDPADALRRIGATDPDVFGQLSVQLQLGKAVTAAHPDVQRQMDALWQQARPALEMTGEPSRIIEALRAKRTQSSSRTDRYAEAQRRAGGAYQANALTGPPPRPAFGAPTNALAVQ